MTRSRPVTLAGDAEREAAIAGGLASDDRVELFMRCVDRIELLAAVRGGDIDGVVVVSPPAWLDEEAMAEARTASVRVVGLAHDPLEAELLRELSISVLPPSATTDEILSELSREVPPSTTPRIQRIGRGRVIAVWGPKGAPGRSRIAVELSFSASAKDPRTLLVDADPDGGDLLQLLGVVEELPTILWATRAAAKKELDPATLQEVLRRASPGGPVLLPGLARPELAADISEAGLKSCIELFRSTFNTTFVDTGRG